MKQLHYGAQVVSISDELALALEESVHLFASNGRAVVLPIACYYDEADTTVQILVSAGVPIMIVDSMLPDMRRAPHYDSDSIAYVHSEIDALENELSGE